MHRHSTIYRIMSICKERIRHVWHGLLRCRNMSLQQAICLLGIVFLCVSCATTSVVTAPPKSVVTGYEEPEQEAVTEANDMACAYFYFLWGTTAENNHRFEEALEAYEKAL